MPGLKRDIMVPNHARYRLRYTPWKPDYNGRKRGSLRLARIPRDAIDPGKVNRIIRSYHHVQAALIGEIVHAAHLVEIFTGESNALQRTHVDAAEKQVIR